MALLKRNPDKLNDQPVQILTVTDDYAAVYVRGKSVYTSGIGVSYKPAHTIILKVMEHYGDNGTLSVQPVLEFSK